MPVSRASLAQVTRPGDRAERMRDETWIVTPGAFGEIGRHVILGFEIVRRIKTGAMDRHRYSSKRAAVGRLK
jgi:hypothetical protein